MVPLVGELLAVVPHRDPTKLVVRVQVPVGIAEAAHVNEVGSGEIADKLVDFGLEA